MTSRPNIDMEVNLSHQLITHSCIALRHWLSIPSNKDNITHDKWVRLELFDKFLIFVELIIRDYIGELVYDHGNHL